MIPVAMIRSAFATSLLLVVLVISASASFAQSLPALEIDSRAAMQAANTLYLAATDWPAIERAGDGKTWTVNCDLIYARRKSAP